METVFGILALIICFVVFVAISLLLGARNLKKENQKWQKEVAGAFENISGDSRFSAFIRKFSIDENRFKVAYHVFANFARIERMSTAEDKLNELTNSDFKALLAIDDDEIGVDESAPMISRVLEALAPFKLSKVDSRGLYYEILYKAFSAEVGCAENDEYLFFVFDIITLGIASKLNNSN